MDSLNNGTWKGGLWSATLWLHGVWREAEKQETVSGIVTGVFSVSAPVTGDAFIFNQVSGRAIINES